MCLINKEKRMVILYLLIKKHSFRNDETPGFSIVAQRKLDCYLYDLYMNDLPFNSVMLFEKSFG